MNTTILLQNVSPERLTELIKDGIKSQLKDFKEMLIEEKKIYQTIEKKIVKLV